MRAERAVQAIPDTTEVDISVPIPEPEPAPLPTGETEFPDVQEGDFVRVGAFPGIVMLVRREDPLNILLDVLCWTGQAREDFARLPWSGSGQVPAWDWVAR